MATSGLMQGTVKPHPGFNSEQDSKALRTAMKGLGTDEKAIIAVLGHRSNQQRQEIKIKYKTLFGKDLEHDLHGEISGHFRQAVLGLLLTPIQYDVEELHRAMSGAGTDENALVEILTTRTNEEILQIKAAYKLKHGTDLEKALVGETSGYFRRLLVSLCTGNRSMDQGNRDKAKQDAQELYAAGEKVMGTDECKFNTVMCARSAAHIRMVIEEYHKVSKHSLEDAIKSEMSGDLKDGMLAILTAVCNKEKYFAQQLHWSMAGAGTNDNTLIRIIISRCEIDMVQIKQEFQKLYGKTLESFITGDTSGDYKAVLLALIGGH